MNKSPIIQMRSHETQLWVQAGWGWDLFWWVAIYDKKVDTREEPIYPISFEEWYNPGFLLPYDWVVGILVNGTRVWVNNTLLSRSKRQDYRGRGSLRLWLFPSDDVRAYIAEYKQQLADLGIQIS